MLLLSRMDVHTTNGEAARNMVIAGVGLGMMMQIFVARRAERGAAPRDGRRRPRSTQFSRSIGATLGVTVMGVIVNQRLPPGVRSEGVAVHRLPPAGSRRARARAAPGVPRRGGGLRSLVFVISLLGVREQPLRRGFEDEAGLGDEAAPQPAAGRK